MRKSTVEALIVVDVQRAFVSGATAVPRADAMLKEISHLLRRARFAGAFVVHLQNDGPPGAVDEPGKPGWELYLPIAEEADEMVIRKLVDDGFHRTSLADELHARRVSSLAICGVMSEMCVSATARSALARGFRVVVPHDAHSTYDIPAVPGVSEMVPSTMVSRVAEWALGDEAIVLATAKEVTFIAPTI